MFKKHVLLSIPCEVCFFFVVLSEKPYYYKNSAIYVHALRCFIVFVKVWKFQILCKSCYYGNRNVKTQSHPEKRDDDNATGNELIYGAVDLLGHISLISSWDFYQEGPYHFKP